MSIEGKFIAGEIPQKAILTQRYRLRWRHVRKQMQRFGQIAGNMFKYKTKAALPASDVQQVPADWAT
jgi:hypothetical protein